MTRQQLSRLPIGRCALTSAAAALAALLGTVPAQAQPASLEADIAELLAASKPARPNAKAAANAAGDVENSRFHAAPDGYLRFLGAAPGRHFPGDAGGVVPGKPEVTAGNFLKKHGKLFGATSPAVDFMPLKNRAKGDRRYVRFQQTYGELPVFAAQVNVQLDDQDGVASVLSDIQRDLASLDTKALSTTPQVTAADARAAVLAGFAAQHPNARLELSEPRLTIFAPAVLGEEGPLHLTWELTAFSEQEIDVDHRVLVDAHSGAVVRQYPLGCTARIRQVYDGNNTTADPGTLRRSEGQAASGFADVDAAYQFLGDTYNFYLNNHGRDGIDGAGMVMSATVRNCTATDCPWSNAQYRSNNRMYFGNGFALDDVTGHELTHGVTGFESGLVYANASGAINESFSDVWGEFIDLGNGAGDDSAAVRWDIGEDLPGGRIRSMSDPTLRNDPDRRNSALYVAPVANPTTDNDFGGVHSNSGVNNKLAYLLTDGDTFNGYTINGLGIARVADLYYEVQTDLLTAGSDWDDLYQALMQAAVNLSWNSADRNNLYRACRAVEIATGGRNIYVDGSSACVFQTGAQNCGFVTGPFHTVVGGNAGVWPGDSLYFRAGSYHETVTFSKVMTIRSYNGSAVIGQ
jgi:Zn-dependent metalloprotease